MKQDFTKWQDFLIFGHHTKSRLWMKHDRDVTIGMHSNGKILQSWEARSFWQSCRVLMRCDKSTLLSIAINNKRGAFNKQFPKPNKIKSLSQSRHEATFHKAASFLDFWPTLKILYLDET